MQPLEPGNTLQDDVSGVSSGNKSTGPPSGDSVDTGRAAPGPASPGSPHTADRYPTTPTPPPTERQYLVRTDKYSKHKLKKHNSNNPRSSSTALSPSIDAPATLTLEQDLRTSKDSPAPPAPPTSSASPASHTFPASTTSPTLPASTASPTSPTSLTSQVSQQTFMHQVTQKEPEVAGSTSSWVLTSQMTVEINGTTYTIVDDPSEYHRAEAPPDYHRLAGREARGAGEEKEVEDEDRIVRIKRGKKQRKKDRTVKESRRVGYQGLEGYSNEYKIKQKLLRDQFYDRTTRPVRNDSSTTTLYVGMSLYHILDTNEKYQTLKALIAVRLRWVDEFLRWDPAQFGGVEHVWVPAMDIWRPDIFINNFADDSFQDFMDTFSIVNYNGSVLWMFPAVVTTYCTLDVRHFPFDRQKCKIIFISWTFHGFKLNVTYNVSEHNTVYYTPKNQEWYVDKIGVDRHEKIYACCSEPYPDVTFTIHMTRRSLFYIINLIFPCLLIYAVSFLGFFLPVESGEKVNLEITILLALVVFLLIVGETLPPTPDAIPALGVLFGTTMLMVSIALVMAVIVTNIFLRKDSGHRVPVCLRKIFIGKSSQNSLSNKVTHAENHVLEAKIHEIEIDNLSNQSEAETLTCRSRCSRKRSGTPYKANDLELHLRMSHEWQVLAKCVDRMFFWLFFAASVAALTSMFLQVPAYNAT